MKTALFEQRFYCDHRLAPRVHNARELTTHQMFSARTAPKNLKKHQAPVI